MLADRGRIKLRDERHAPLGDRRFLSGNVRQTVTEELLMVERKVGDAGDERMLDDVGRVEPAAETDLEDAGVGGRSRERHERRGGRDLEEARLDVRPRRRSLRVRIAASSSSSISRPAIRIRSLKRTRCGLVKAWTLWPLASSAARRKATVEPFPLVPADVKDRRKRVLRTAEPLEQRRNPLQPQPVARRRKLRQSVELRLDLRVGRAREIRHQAASFASGAR